MNDPDDLLADAREELEKADELLTEAAIVAREAVRVSVAALRAARKAAGRCIACGQRKARVDQAYARCKSCRVKHARKPLRRSA